jgi:hypothetical protein
MRSSLRAAWARRPLRGEALTHWRIAERSILF